MNYISSSVSAVKHLEERKEKKKTDLISRKRKFQCLNMQLTPGAAKQNSSFSALSMKQPLVSLHATVLVYYRSFTNRKSAYDQVTLSVKSERGRKKSKKKTVYPHKSSSPLLILNHTAPKRELVSPPWRSSRCHGPVGAHVTAPSIS